MTLSSIKSECYVDATNSIIEQKGCNYDTSPPHILGWHILDDTLMSMPNLKLGWGKIGERSWIHSCQISSASANAWNWGQCRS